MKINELVKVGEKIETYTVTIPAEYDENGNITKEAYTEEREKTVPIMESVTRELTEEEIEQFEEQERHQYDGVNYEQLVSMFIRERYSLDEELALHRQRDVKVEEFEVYNSYCEDCKIRAKEIKETQSDTIA